MTRPVFRSMALAGFTAQLGSGGWLDDLDRLRQPIHPVLAEKQPAGATGTTSGPRRRTNPGVAAVTAVADHYRVAARPAVTA